MKALRGVLAGKSETIRRAKNDGQKSKRERKVVLSRRWRTDDCTRMKAVKFIKKKSDTTATLSFLVAGYITPQELSIKYIEMYNYGEFKGEFQRELDRRKITPQCNGVADRALELLREKTIAVMEEPDGINGRKKHSGLR